MRHALVYALLTLLSSPAMADPANVYDPDDAVSHGSKICALVLAGILLLLGKSGLFKGFTTKDIWLFIFPVVVVVMIFSVYMGWCG